MLLGSGTETATIRSLGYFPYYFFNHRNISQRTDPKRLYPIHTYKEHDEHPAVEYAAVLTNMLFSVVFLFCSLVLASFSNNMLNAQGLATLLYYYCITLLLLIPFSYIEIFLTARKDFKGIFWMYFLPQWPFARRHHLLLFFRDTNWNELSLAILYAHQRLSDCALV